MLVPTMSGLLATSQEWFATLQPWVDLNLAQSFLFEGMHTGAQWAHLLTTVAEHVGQTVQSLFLPASDLGRVDAEHLCDLGSRLVRLDGLNGHFGLQAGWMTFADLGH